MSRSRTAAAAVLSLAVALALAMAAGSFAGPAQAAPAAINGSGSTYVALAMQQWVADAQTRGLRINYTPTGSPDGLQQYGNRLTDFAGTEAEFSALQVGGGGGAQRGYQYVPDVAGAIAVMYNADDKAGRKVDWLQLSRQTIARIFMGDITHWNDPAITADNMGYELPAEPITVVYRGGQSGTTALFYDFVANMDPAGFQSWAARNQLPTNVRIIQLDSSPGFAPKTRAFNGSEQIAQFVASPSGKWSIAYDEFGYAVTYNAAAAYVQNQAGQWVLPYAANISAALESASLRPDLSQELSGVYTSTNPLAYPISAYSYLVTQCAPAGDRPTCQGQYGNPGVTETLAQWMRYIACEGQIAMADIGYSPLPPNLSQEMANSIARLTGGPPEQLSADNCANPRFRGNFGGSSPNSPEPPLEQQPAGPAAAGGGGGGGGEGGGGAGPTGSIDQAGGGEVASGAGLGPTSPEALGRSGSATRAVGGGSSSWKDSAPVAYTRPDLAGSPLFPVLVVVAIVAIPPLVLGLGSAWRRRQEAGTGGSPTVR